MRPPRNSTTLGSQETLPARQQAAGQHVAGNKHLRTDLVLSQRKIER